MRHCSSLERIAVPALTVRVTLIPIAERAAPSAHITRGFVLWRLSDAGHRAHGTVVHGRHPKPCTDSDIPADRLIVSARGITTQYLGWEAP